MIKGLRERNEEATHQVEEEKRKKEKVRKELQGKLKRASERVEELESMLRQRTQHDGDQMQTLQASLSRESTASASLRLLVSQVLNSLGDLAFQSQVIVKKENEEVNKTIHSLFPNTDSVSRSEEGSFASMLQKVTGFSSHEANDLVSALQVNPLQSHQRQSQATPSQEAFKQQMMQRVSSFLTNPINEQALLDLIRNLLLSIQEVVHRSYARAHQGKHQEEVTVPTFIQHEPQPPSSSYTSSSHISSSGKTSFDELYHQFFEDEKQQQEEEEEEEEEEEIGSDGKVTPHRSFFHHEERSPPSTSSPLRRAEEKDVVSLWQEAESSFYQHRGGQELASSWRK
jgi:hypothetical protein